MVVENLACVEISRHNLAEENIFEKKRQGGKIHKVSGQLCRLMLINLRNDK